MTFLKLSFYLNIIYDHVKSPQDLCFKFKHYNKIYLLTQDHHHEVVIITLWLSHSFIAIYCWLRADKSGLNTCYLSLKLNYAPQYLFTCHPDIRSAALVLQPANPQQHRLVVNIEHQNLYQPTDLLLDLGWLINCSLMSPTDLIDKWRTSKTHLLASIYCGFNCRIMFRGFNFCWWWVFY